MKTFGKGVLGAVALLLLSHTSSFAIEGLHVSVLSSNAVLSWPSTTNETYIVQYRSNLNAASSWVTLTNYFPPADDTNLTFFVHSNSVQYPYFPSGGNGGGGGVPAPGGTNTSGGGTNTWSVTTGFYRVVRDGPHIYGIPNGMILSNELVTTIEFALDSTDQVVGVTFYDGNNSPLIGASAQSVGDNAWRMVWNTTLSFNGDYTIYAEINFASDDSVVSQPVTVTVNNTISFPNYFSRIFGDQMWIYAETIPAAAYQIDMFDENTNYLGTFSDTADGSGVISFLWDLTDGSGNTFASTNFFGVFTVDTSGSSHIRSQVAVKSGAAADFQAPAKKNYSNKFKASTPGVHPNTPNSSSANQLWTKEPHWTPNNNWVIAYASLTGDSTVDQKATDMILGGPGEDTDYGGVLGTLDEYGLIGNLSPGNNGQAGTVFTLQDSTTRTSLLSYLADHRYENFYYFGHGNNSVISAYNASQTAITGDQIAVALGNVPLSYPILHAAYHPYRFVWMDACNTASGNLCESFGIPAMTISTNFFATAGVESRAFIGFKQPTGFDPSNSSADHNSWPNRSILTGEFLSAWLGGNLDLNTIVQNAKNNFGNFGYNMNSSVVIYGAYDLKRFTRTRP